MAKPIKSRGNLDQTPGLEGAQTPLGLHQPTVKAGAGLPLASQVCWKRTQTGPFNEQNVAFGTREATLEFHTGHAEQAAGNDINYFLPRWLAGLDRFSTGVYTETRRGRFAGF
jgi:hypothetical protein